MERHRSLRPPPPPPLRTRATPPLHTHRQTHTHVCTHTHTDTHANKSALTEKNQREGRPKPGMRREDTALEHLNGYSWYKCHTVRYGNMNSKETQKLKTLFSAFFASFAAHWFDHNRIIETNSQLRRYDFSCLFSSNHKVIIRDKKKIGISTASIPKNTRQMWWSDKSDTIK